MKLQNLINLLLIWAIVLLLGGCGTLAKGKIMGDDQVAKFEAGSNKFKGDDQMVKAEQNVRTDEISAIKKAMADLKGQMSAQMGMINKTMTDQSNKEAGGNIIQNNPEMINLFVIVFAITVGVPYLSILLIFYFYMRYNEKAQKRLVEQKEEKDGSSN